MSLPFSPSRQILFPGEESWELWVLEKGKDPELVDTPSPMEPFGFLPGGRRKILALPGAAFTSVPFLSSAQDHRSLVAAARLYLEDREISCDPDGAGVQFVAGIVPRTLTRIDAPLDRGVSDHFARLDSDQVFSSPGLLELPAGAVAVWKEFGETVVAVEKNGRAAHYETLLANGEAELATELNRIIRKMEGQGLLDEVREICLWNGMDAEKLRSITSYPVRTGERPAPRNDENTAPVQPAWFRERQMAKNAAGNRRRKIQWSAFGGAVGIGLIAAVLSMSDMEIRRLGDRIAELRPAAERSGNLKARWDEVAPVVERDSFLLETWRSLAMIPESSLVRLSRMRIDADGIFLRCEARSLMVALRFVDGVTKCPAFGHLRWEYNEPDVREDGSTLFDLNGFR